MLSRATNAVDVCLTLYPAADTHVYAEEHLASLREATDLPVGYQSYTITPSKNCQPNTEGVPTNQFEHLYLVPHPHLVLMTHSIKFEVGAAKDVQDSVPMLASSPAMSLLATHPEVLSAEDRESIFAGQRHSRQHL